jgi:RimJ/RimL family protein N-acetyltransferase
MTALRILPLDPFDDAALDAWHRVYRDAELASGPGIGDPWQLEEVRALLQTASERYRKSGWSGVLDGRVVTVGLLREPLRDNPERAEVAVHTAPDVRRRGYGAAMLAHLEEVTGERGRTILVGEASWRYDAGPAGAGETGPEFAAAQGYTLALGDVKRVLQLPVADGTLHELAAEAAAAHADYTLLSFVGPVPEALVLSWATLVSSLMTEAPTGDLDVEPEAADPALVRETEALVEKQGRTKYNTVALDAAGDVVAYTDLATTVHEPGRAYQWGTLVRRDARGHRLGLAVKVANLRLLQAERPDVTLLTTYNAEVNERMVAVNERLGFRPVARLGEFQKRA